MEYIVTRPYKGNNGKNNSILSIYSIIFPTLNMYPYPYVFVCVPITYLDSNQVLPLIVTLRDYVKTSSNYLD